MTHRVGLLRAAALAAILLLGLWLLGARAAEACWTVEITEIVRVIDGDTFVARLRVWQQIEAVEILRVLGVDTPELRGGTEATRERAARATGLTTEWLAQGPAFAWSCRRDSFGRPLAKIYRGPSVLAEELIAAGLGVAP